MSIDILNNKVQIGDLVIYSRYKRGGLNFGIVVKLTPKQIQVCDTLNHDKLKGIYFISDWYISRVNNGDYVKVSIEAINIGDRYKQFLQQVQDFVLNKPVKDIV